MLKNNFGLKKLGFGGARPSTATRLAGAIQDPSATNGLVSGGNWATGITSGVKGFLTGLGAMRDMQNERAYEQDMEKKYQDQLATEAAEKEQAQANWQATFDQNKANAERDFNLKALSAGIDPAKMGQEGYLEELQQQKLDQANALKQAQYEREDAVAKQAHDYKMAQIAAQNQAKKPEQSEYEKALGREQAKKESEAAERLQNQEEIYESSKQIADKLVKLADEATYSLAGRGLDLGAYALGFGTKGSVAREAYTQTVANELIPKLKQMLGGQFTEKDREALMGTLGNPNNTPAEKKAAITAYMETRLRDLQAAQKEYNKVQSAKQGNQSISDLW